VGLTVETFLKKQQFSVTEEIPLIVDYHLSTRQGQPALLSIVEETVDYKLSDEMLLIPRRRSSYSDQLYLISKDGCPASDSAK
jgi:hypothetical protein